MTQISGEIFEYFEGWGRFFGVGLISLIGLIGPIGPIGLINHMELIRLMRRWVMKVIGVGLGLD